MTGRSLASSLLFVLILGSCALPGADSASMTGSDAISYHATADAVGMLRIVARFPDPPPRLVPHPRSGPFFREVTARRAGRESVVLVPDPDGAYTPPSGTREFTWTFALDEAAREIGGIAIASRIGNATLSPPSAWLLRPAPLRSGRPVELTVITRDGIRFATGIPEASSSGSHRFLSDHLDDLPYSVFGPFETSRISLDGSRITVARLPGRLGVSDPDLLRWIERCARAVEVYYGRYPVEHALVIVAPGRRGVGSASGTGGASIYLPVSSRTSRAALSRDWVLVHEMVHLAFPQTAPRHNWLDEGIATYVEPLGRARIGDVTPAQVWKDLVEGLPHGLPRPGDRGLDHTPTWGRTYWGGALFCLLADLEIHERTGGAHGLEDALRAIVNAGGNITTRWTIDRVLETADAAVGVPVFRELYDRMSASPHPVDLDRLFRKLGVISSRGRVTFDDQAPAAGFRRKLTERIEH